MYKSISDSWSDLRGRSIDDCVNSYLGIARSFYLFGSKLFEAKVPFKIFFSKFKYYSLAFGLRFCLSSFYDFEL